MTRYLVISPAKDEQQHIVATLDSMLSQTLKPARWIIVDDGSTDCTADIVASYCREHPWISLVRRDASAERRPGSPVVRAFLAGLEAANGITYDFIVKLDCDLRLPPTYFEDLLQRFDQESRLGIASGVYREERQGRWNAVEMPRYHAAGASKVIRSCCYQEIGGFLPVAGWDTIDEIRAQARGWRTGHFPDLQFDHLRAEGSARGALYTNRFHGEIYYLTGGSWSFFLLKVVHRMLTGKPPLIAGLLLLTGYLGSALRRRERLVSRAEAKAYRKTLSLRMRDAVAAPIRRLVLRGSGQI